MLFAGWHFPLIQFDIIPTLIIHYSLFTNVLLATFSALKPPPIDNLFLFCLFVVILHSKRQNDEKINRKYKRTTNLYGILLEHVVY